MDQQNHTNQQSEGSDSRPEQNQHQDQLGSNSTDTNQQPQSNQPSANVPASAPVNQPPVHHPQSDMLNVEENEQGEEEMEELIRDNGADTGDPMNQQ